MTFGVVVVEKCRSFLPLFQVEELDVRRGTVFQSRSRTDPDLFQSYEEAQQSKEGR